MVTCKCEDSSLVFVLSGFLFFLFLTFIFHPPPPPHLCPSPQSLALSLGSILSLFKADRQSTRIDILPFGDITAHLE